MGHWSHFIGFIIGPFLLGLSSGLFCVSLCFPFIAPVLAAEDRKTNENIQVLGKFILGRLAGYVLFGALTGYIGSKVAGKNLEFTAALSVILLSVVLILYGMGFLSRGRWFCCGPNFKKRTPFLMGFLMGLNACPPFLMSLGTVFNFHDCFKGMVFFFIFFLGTTVYFLPGIFVGALGRMKELRIAARASAVVVGGLFLIYNITVVMGYAKH